MSMALLRLPLAFLLRQFFFARGPVTWAKLICFGDLAEGLLLEGA